MTQRARFSLWFLLFVAIAIGLSFVNSHSVQMQKLWVELDLRWLPDALKTKILLLAFVLVAWAISFSYKSLAAFFRDKAVYHAISSKRLGYFSGIGYRAIDIAMQLGRSQGSVTRSLNRLQENGKAVETDDGWYST